MTRDRKPRIGLIGSDNVDIEIAYAAIAFGRRHGVKTRLNPAPANPTLDIEKIREAGFLVPNETEQASPTGPPVSTEDEIGLAARSLLATPAGLHRVAPIRVAPVDTTGA